MLSERLVGTKGFQRLWVFVGSDSRALTWKEDKNIADPMLIDSDQSAAWDWFIGHEDGAFANYPRHFVIDRDGVLTYVGTNTSPDALEAAILATLGE